MIRIDLSGKVDWLDKCVAAEAIAFRLLRSHLLELEAQYEDPYQGLNDPAIRYAIDQLYGRLNSLLGEKLLDAAALWEHEDIVIALFWGEGSEALKELPPPEPSTAASEDEFRLEEPSSGDAFADLLAKLITVDNTVAGAMELLHRYSLDTLVCMTQQLNALRKPEKERMEEAKTKYFQDTIAYAKESDPALYQQILGLAPAKPL